MNPIHLLIAATILLAGGSYLLLPGDEELVYVYQKSGQWQEVERITKKGLAESYDKDLHKAYIHSLVHLKRKNIFKEARTYFKDHYDRELLDSLVAYCETYSEYENYLFLINLGFEASKDPVYLEKKANFFSFTGKMDEQVVTLKKLYTLTGWIRILETLYTLEQKNYVIDALKSRINDLGPDMKLALVRYLLWEDRIREAFDLVAEHLDLGVLPIDLLKIHLTHANFFFDRKETLRCLEHMYDRFPNYENLLNWAEKAIYLGDLKRGIPLLEQAYEEKKELRVLERLITAFKDTGDFFKAYKYQNLALATMTDFVNINEHFYMIAMRFGASKAVQDMEVLKARWEKEKTEVPEGILYDFNRLKLDFQASVGDTEKLLRDLTLKSPTSLQTEELLFIISNATKEKSYLDFRIEHYQREPDAYYLKALLDCLKDRETKLSVFHKYNPHFTQENLPVYLSLIQRSELKDTVEKVHQSKDKDMIRILFTYLLNRNDLKLALNSLLEIRKLDPNQPVYLKEEAHLHEKMGNPGRAARLMELYLEKRGDDAMAFYHQAQYLERIGKMEASLRYYKKADKLLDLGKPEERRAKAQSAFKTRGAIPAIKILKPLADKELDDFYLQNEYLEYLLQANRFDLIEKRISQLKAPREARFSLYRYRLQLLLHDEKYEETQALIEEMAKKANSENDFRILAQYRFELAAKFKNLKKEDLAKEQYRRLLFELDSIQARITPVRAYAHYVIHGAKEALPLYQYLINQGNMSDDVMFTYLSILKELKSYTTLISSLELLTEEQRNKPAFRNFALQVHMEGKDLDEAYKIIKTLDEEEKAMGHANLDDSYIYLRYDLAGLMEQNGRIDLAQTQWKWLLKHLPDETRFLPLRAYSALKITGPETALPYYQTFLRSKTRKEVSDYLWLEYFKVLELLGKNKEIDRILSLMPDLETKFVDPMVYRLNQLLLKKDQKYKSYLELAKKNLTTSNYVYVLSDLSGIASENNLTEEEKYLDHLLLEFATRTDTAVVQRAQILLKIGQTEKVKHILPQEFAKTTDPVAQITILEMLWDLGDREFVIQKFPKKHMEHIRATRLSLLMQALQGKITDLDQKLARLEPQSRYYTMGDILALMKEPGELKPILDKRRFELSKALKLPMREVAELAMLQGKQEEALEYYEKAITNEKPGPWIASYFELLQSKDQDERILKQYSSLPESLKTTDSILQIAFPLLLEKNEPELIRMVDKLMKEDPLRHKTLQSLFTQKAKPGSDYAEYLQGLLNAPILEREENLLIQARIYSSLSRYKEASNLLLYLLPEIQGQQEVLAELLRTLFESGRLRDFYDLSMVLPSQTRATEEFYTLYCNVLFYLGKYEELHEAIENPPDLASKILLEIHYGLAFSLHEKKVFHISRPIFEKIRRENTGNSFQERLRVCYATWLLEGDKNALPYFQNLEKDFGLKSEYSLDYLRILYTMKKQKAFESKLVTLDEKTKATDRYERMLAELYQNQGKLKDSRNLLVIQEQRLTGRSVFVDGSPTLVSREQILKRFEDKPSYERIRIREDLAYLMDQLGYLMEVMGQKAHSLNYYREAYFYKETPERKKIIDYLQDYLASKLRFQTQSSNGLNVRRYFLEKSTSDHFFTLLYQETSDWNEWRLMMEDINRDKYKLALSSDLKSYHLEWKGPVSLYLIKDHYNEYLEASFERMYRQKIGAYRELRLSHDRSLRFEVSQSRYDNVNGEIAKLHQYDLTYYVPTGAKAANFIGLSYSDLKSIQPGRSGVFFSGSKGITASREFRGELYNTWEWEFSLGTYYDFDAFSPIMRVGLRKSKWLYAWYSLGYDRFAKEAVESFFIEVKKNI